MIADALDRVHRVPNIAVSTGGYTVWRNGPTPQDRSEHWQAGQSLDLHGHDGAAVLKLVGELQEYGLAVGQLGWRLSDDAARKARAEAQAEALKALRGRADAAAALLDLQFDAFKEVRLDTPRPPTMPRGMVAMAAKAAPPSAESEDVEVSATADADVLLKPR